MGLDVGVSEYESDEYMSKRLGSYHRYNDWRRNIASAVGFDLDEMTGFGGNMPWHKEPFQLILCHSAYDGLYSVNQLHKLQEEVKEIKQLGIDDSNQCDKFIKLIEHAIKVNKPLEFR